MSGNTYTVQPGAPQQFTGANIPKNSVIVNISSKGSIWISSEQYVAPGIGIELNPAASVTWIGKQLWACLDPNAVDVLGDPLPVDFTVTDDISNINDPVAVAEALIIQGVPNTFLVDLLFSGDVDGFTPHIDVSKYASLIIEQTGAASSDGFSWLYQFKSNSVDSGNGIISTPGSGPDWVLSTTLPPFQIPVSGTSFQMLNQTGESVTVSIYGTNRNIDRTQVVDDNLIINELVTQGPFTAGTNYLLNGGILSPPPRSGWITFTATISGTAVKGIFYLFDFNVVGLDIADSDEMHVRSDGNRSITKVIKIPPEPMAIVFLCTDDGGADPADVLFRYAG